DPLLPRLALHNADYAASGEGPVNIVCEFPHQVVPAGSKIAVTISFDEPTALPHLALQLYRIPKSEAMAEALDYRKFILHALYTPCSEARPWNVWNNPGDDEKYLSAGKTGDALQDRLRPYVQDIVTTLNECRALDPENKDPIVRQYHEGIFRKIISKAKKG